MFLDAAPIALGLNFFITIPKKSTVAINTDIILSLNSFLVTKVDATTNYSASFLSSLSVLFRVSLIISIPFYR
jgi:hypothetical protein